MRVMDAIPVKTLTVREVAALCGVDKRTVYYWIQRGELEATHNEFHQLRVNWFEAERVKSEKRKAKA
jgi:predicted site-specific integrase-resolvase